MALLVSKTKIDKDMTQLLGQWRSDTMFRYLHLQLQAEPITRDFARRISSMRSTPSSQVSSCIVIVLNPPAACFPVLFSSGWRMTTNGWISNGKLLRIGSGSSQPESFTSIAIGGIKGG